MAFTSIPFLFLFLPAVLAGFYLLRGPQLEARRAWWLLAMSVAFYAASGALNSLVLILSLGLNFFAARWLVGKSNGEEKKIRLAFAFVVTSNVALLLAFKYLAAESQGGGAYLISERILIPLGLSFITFQQIAFLLDCKRGRVTSFSVRDYLLFITFFPQLVMGPIVHFRQLSPQLRDGRLATAFGANFSVGFAIFCVGLFKKVVLADSLSPSVDAVFGAAKSGESLHLLDAWFGAVAFQLQLFLDFSGYADMAIGLAKMCNIDLPINFDRPLHAVSRFDLWRRWHITFVEFMRTHVFQPLARISGMPLWVALTITGMASGLWHGFGFTFLLWGGIQTALLLISHYWGRWRRNGWLKHIPRVTLIQIAITFGVTSLVGVMFRAESVSAAILIFRGLIDFQNAALPIGILVLADRIGLQLSSGQAPDLLIRMTDVFPLAGAAITAWFLPQCRELFVHYWTAPDPRQHRASTTAAPKHHWWQFRLNATWGLIIGLLLITSLLLLGQAQRFVYYQF